MKELEHLKPKEQVQKIKEWLQAYIDIPLTVLFSKHSSAAILKDVRLATLKDMVNNRPAKRNGKTPSVVFLQFDCFKCFIVIDDIVEIKPGINNTTIVMQWGGIKLCR